MTEGFFPISEISTYHTKWTIRARVTQKGTLRTFTRQGSAQSNQVFDVCLLDESGSEIKANFFGAMCDKYYGMLEAGKCFTFSRGTVKIANRSFNRCNHRYEIVFDRDGIIEQVADDAKIDSVKFSFTDLRAVQAKTLPCTVDLCGIIVTSQPAMAFTSQAGKELVKRDFTFADDTATTMKVTCWGDRAKQDDQVFEGNRVVCLKGVNIKEFQGGRSGSLPESGAMVFDAKNADIDRVTQWWSSKGSSMDMTSLSTPQDGLGARGGTQSAASMGKSASIDEMRIASENVGATPEMFNVICRLALVQTRKQGEAQPLHYMACQEPKNGNGLPCNKRLGEDGFCAVCNRAGKSSARMLLRCRFSDHTDSAWLTTFHEGAQRVLNMSADACKEIETGAGGHDAVEAKIRKTYFSQPYQISVRAKSDMYQGEMRANITCTDCRPVNWASHGRTMLSSIKDMLSQNTATLLVAGA